MRRETLAQLNERAAKALFALAQDSRLLADLEPLTVAQRIEVKRWVIARALAFEGRARRRRRAGVQTSARGPP